MHKPSESWLEFSLIGHFFVFLRLYSELIAQLICCLDRLDWLFDWCSWLVCRNKTYLTHAQAHTHSFQIQPTMFVPDGSVDGKQMAYGDKSFQKHKHDQDKIGKKSNRNAISSCLDRKNHFRKMSFQSGSGLRKSIPTPTAAITITTTTSTADNKRAIDWLCEPLSRKGTKFLIILIHCLERGNFHLKNVLFSIVFAFFKRKVHIQEENPYGWNSVGNIVNEMKSSLAN